MFNLLSLWSENNICEGIFILIYGLIYSIFFDRSPVTTVLIGLVLLYYVFKHNTNTETTSSLMVWSHVGSVTSSRIFIVVVFKATYTRRAPPSGAALSEASHISRAQVKYINICGLITV